MWITSRRDLHAIRRPRATRQQLAAVRLAEPAAPAPTFVPPHRCAHCGGNTDASPCHRCGFRGPQPERRS